MTFRLSQDQAVFLRDVLDRYLNDKRSLLHMPAEAQRALRLQDENAFQASDDIHL
jgi:hypothetical protein